MKIEFENCTVEHHKELAAWCYENIGAYGNGWHFYWNGNFERNVVYTFDEEKTYMWFKLRWS